MKQLTLLITRCIHCFNFNCDFVAIIMTFNSSNMSDVLIYMISHMSTLKIKKVLTKWKSMKRFVDETRKLKMMQIACNSLAKNINHFFYWWKMNFHDNNINSAFLTFFNCSWKYVDHNVFFIVFEIVSRTLQYKVM